MTIDVIGDLEGRMASQRLNIFWWGVSGQKQSNKCMPQGMETTLWNTQFLKSCGNASEVSWRNRGIVPGPEKKLIGLASFHGFLKLH